MAEDKSDFSYLEGDGENCVRWMALVREDGTLRDKPEDYPPIVPDGLLDVPSLSNVEFAKVVVANRKEILAEYAWIIYKRENAADFEARDRVDART